MSVRLMMIYLLLVLAACSAQATGAPIVIAEPWVRAVSVAVVDHGAHSGHGSTSAASDVTSAAYLVITNRSQTDDQLLAARSPEVAAIEMHNSALDENGVMRMRPLAAIDLPAGESVRLEPGGFHLMLIGIKRDLVAGSSLTIELEFAQAGRQVVQATVRAP